MVQSLSLSTLSTSGNSFICGSIPSWKRDFKLIRKPHVAIGSNCLEKLQLAANPSLFGSKSLRVQAGWLFNKGGEQGSGASAESSESANEDILIFFFQLDLATRVQVCLAVFGH
uniref:DNA binding protein n=1 Tax=Rhizophora mucronata TaxID=61149 RepID=A0A2P2KUY7_RHIMU